MFSKFLEGEETSSKADAKFNGFIVDKKNSETIEKLFSWRK